MDSSDEHDVDSTQTSPRTFLGDTDDETQFPEGDRLMSDSYHSPEFFMLAGGIQLPSLARGIQLPSLVRGINSNG